MGFKGYLLKINGTELPVEYIRLNSYSSKPNQIMDLDSYRDADGVLHRSVLPHTATIISFNTKYLWLEEKIILQNILPSNRTRFELEYWNDETNEYTKGEFYMPDVEFKVYRIDKEKNSIYYEPVKLEFIEY